MSYDALSEMVKIPEKILAHILAESKRHAPSYDQGRIEKVVKARGLLIEASALLHDLGIHDAGDACEFEVSCASMPGNGGAPCERYDECKEQHELYMMLIGGWELYHIDEIGDLPTEAEQHG